MIITPYTAATAEDAPEQGEAFYDVWYRGRRDAVAVLDQDDFTYGPLLRLVAQHITPGTRMLDYGCGDGIVALFAAARGADVLGVDFSREAVARATAYVKAHAIANARFAQLEFRKVGALGPFDLVWASEVIEHVSDDVGLVAWIARQLRPDGTCILTTRLASDPGHRFRRWLRGRDWIDEADGHVRRYDAEGLTRILEGAGLRVVKVSTREGLIRTLIYKSWTGGKIFRVLSRFGAGRWSMDVADAAAVKLFGAMQLIVVAIKAA